MGLVRRSNIKQAGLASCIPIKRSTVLSEPTEVGVLLTLPMSETGSRLYRWMGKRLPLAAKRFELEAVGARVWGLCDGENTPKQIAKVLQREFNLNRLEAEASLSQYLHTLHVRGLIEIRRVDP